MQKKGQITIYIVLGIIVMVSIILMVYYQDVIFKSEWERERAASLTVPQKVKPLQEYMLACIKQTTVDGLNLMGYQGGYVDVPNNDAVPNSAFSSTLYTFNNNYKTAFWLYKSQNGLLKTNIPQKEDMERFLENYINNNLGYCTLNFTMFEKLNVSVGEIDSDVQIRPEVVLVTVKHPILVSVDDFNFRFDRFYQDVKSSYGRMYEIAKEIFEQLNKKNLLEDYTIDVLSVNPDVPYSGTEKSCTPLFWNVVDVQNAIKDGLENNIQALKVDGASFTKKNDYFLLDILKKDLDNMHVNFRYSKSWPFFMEVYPSENGVLKAEPISNPKLKEMAYVSSYLCLVDYNFIYDIAYPVVVTLSDDEGNFFQFAYQVIIDNNQPKQNLLGTEDFDESNTKICEAATTPINVYVYDAETYQPIDGARVDLKCVTTMCQLGQTQYNELGQVLLKSVAPACVNAQMIASKKGYNDGRETVDTVDPGDVTIYMDKFRNLDYEIKLVEESGYVRDLSEDETIIFTLTEEDKKYSTTLINGKDKVNLIPGNYKINAYVSKESDDGFFIQGKNFENCVDVPERGLLGIFFGAQETNCYTAKTEDVTLNQIMIGGMNLEFEILSSDLDKNKVTFYVPVWDVPQTQDGMFEIQQKIDVGERVILPEFE
ncbi:hypothetical protein D6777_03320 [Candidatus Woesearchaeota archaeon]|nr:MAG: hypothetical protein D6777_03320 [Candidatus Woesearchaeota archaeon]